MLKKKKRRVRVVEKDVFSQAHKLDNEFKVMISKDEGFSAF
jgi:hypothetical protein